MSTPSTPVPILTEGNTRADERRGSPVLSRSHPAGPGGLGPFVSSPPPLQAFPSPRGHKDRVVTTPHPISRPTQDYFSAQEGSSGNNPPSHFTPGGTRRTRRDEWTLFGQLLEDDRTPGARGSETPVHAVRNKSLSRFNAPPSRSNLSLSSPVPPSSSIQSSLGWVPLASPGSFSGRRRSQTPGGPRVDEPQQIRPRSLHSTADYRSDTLMSASESSDDDSHSGASNRPSRSPPF